MSDLISRSELYMNDLIRRKDVLALFPTNDCSDKMVGLYERVLDIPTAYDKQAVIEQLEQQAEQYRRREIEAEQKGFSRKAEKYYGKQWSYLHSVEIVKAGGIDG